LDCKSAAKWAENKGIQVAVQFQVIYQHFEAIAVLKLSFGQPWPFNSRKCLFVAVKL